MIIQHNIMALNSYNKLSTNNSAVQKNLEKLSSGYRINRAGDDAAGLAISEKMRAQITGLERAKLNAQDGISLVQTAEGALTEVHSMLNRLVELGTESANGIYQAEDREKIQSEVDQILEEIDRIAESTNFNGIKLLDGSLDSKKIDEIAKNNGTQVTMPTGTLNATGVSGTFAGVANTGVKADPVKDKAVLDLAKANGTDDAIAAFTDAKTEVLTITFETAAGETKSFSIYEGTAKEWTSAGDDDEIAAVINGIGKSGFGNVDDAKVAEEFLNNFTVKGDGAAGGTALTIEAKEGGLDGAKLKSVKYGEWTAAGDVGTKEIIRNDGSVDAQKGGVKISFTDNGTSAGTAKNAVAGDKLTIGDKTYEFYASTATAADIAKIEEKGNVAVAINGTAGSATAGEIKGTMDNLIDALKKNGVDAEYASTAYAGAGTGVLSKPGSPTELLITTPLGSAEGALGSWKEATSQEFKIDGTKLNAKFAAAEMDSVSFTYTVDGKQKSFTLYETGIDSVIVGTAGNVGKAIAATINGEAGADSRLAFNTSTNASLEEFRNNFTVTAAADGTLTITSKGTGSTAARMEAAHTLQGAGGSTNLILDATGGANLATNAAVTNAVTNKKAQDSGIVVDMTGVMKDDQITIGDKTYQFVNALTDEVGRGNTAVLKGATDTDTVANLVNALKRDGVEAEKVEGEDKLLITDMEALSGAQSGLEVKASNSDVRIEQTNTTANTTEVTFGDTAAGTYTMKVSYTDENGNNKTEDVTYTVKAGNTTGSGVADAVASAIANNDNLRGLFSTDAENGKLTITAKADGTGGAKINGLQTTDTTSGAISTSTSTDGIDQGKTISFADGKNMSAGDTIEIGGKTFEFVKQGESAKEGNIAVAIGKADGAETMENLQKALKEQGVESTLGGTNNRPTLYIADKETFTKNSSKAEGGLTLQVGDTSDDFNKVTVYVADMSSKGLGLDNLQVTDQGLASDSIDKVKGAIEKVSVARGNLGALQNRLEHTINNLATTTENMTAAESRIRDTDMAKEMMNFTKNNVLVQAAQAMLAQANQQPQQVLQLLR